MGTLLDGKQGKKVALICTNSSFATIFFGAGQTQSAHLQAFNIRLGTRIIAHMSKIRISGALCWALPFGLLASAFLFGACTRERSVGDGAGDPVLQARKDRDRAFKSGPESPLPAEDKARFQGLDYFPINAALRFRLKLNRHPVPARIRMATNTGEVREGLRYGYFEFTVGGQTCRLQAYRMDENESPGHAYLFIPFRDATTGKETYGAGRYLDLPENTSGIYDLDFNRAYNPFCAYGGDFSCPTPPDENKLAVLITAGEKKYPLARSY